MSKTNVHSVRIPTAQLTQKNRDATEAFFSALNKLVAPYVDYIRRNQDVLIQARRCRHDIVADWSYGTENRAAGYFFSRERVIALTPEPRETFYGIPCDATDPHICVYTHEHTQQGYDDIATLTAESPPEVLTAGEARKILEDFKKAVTALRKTAQRADDDIETINKLALKMRQL